MFHSIFYCAYTQINGVEVIKPDTFHLVQRLIKHINYKITININYHKLQNMKKIGVCISVVLTKKDIDIFKKLFPEFISVWVSVCAFWKGVVEIFFKDEWHHRIFPAQNNTKTNVEEAFKMWHTTVKWNNWKK